MGKGIDFCIIGAPKCGTTSIAYYLSQHPGVDFAQIKEPFYYNGSTPSVHGVTTETDFQALFKNDGRPKGEGSTWYLYSGEAVRNILSDNPAAKFIVCLRSPATAVISWHAHMRLVGAELEPDFLNAWRASDCVKVKKKPIPVYGDSRMLDYKNLYAYGDQFEKLLTLVDPTKVHIIEFEDLSRCPSSVYRKLLEFLDLENDGREEFPVQYPRTSTRSSALRFLGSRISYSRRIALTRFALRFNVDLYDIYFRLNTRTAQKNNVSTEIQQEINAHYQPQLDKLLKLTGIQIGKL